MLNRIRSLITGGGRVSSSNPTVNPQCAEFEVNNWEISNFIRKKLIPVVGVQPFPLHELMLMSAAVCRLRPTQIFEWGTHVGKSARVFYECAKHYEIPVQIHSIDLPDDVDHVEHPHQARGELVRGLLNVQLHQGNGVETAVAIWRSDGCQSSPLFLVDGDHSYESVLRELSLITSSIPDANVLLHDTFYQSIESGYNIGPHQAIEEVLRNHPERYRRIDSGLGLPGMTLLYQLRS